MKICLVSSNQIVKERIDFFGGANIQVSVFSATTINFGLFDLVLIVEPFDCNGSYVSIHQVWKRYLAINAPFTKLIVAGFEPIDHPNYLNLLRLGKHFDWEATIENALPVAQGWDSDLQLQSGLNILKKISLFFEGHNNEGIVDTITKLRGSLDNARIRLNGSDILKIDKVQFSSVWKNILRPKRPNSRILFSRWFNYSAYFECLPFCNELRQIKANEFIREINDFFSGKESLSPPKLEQKKRDFTALDGYNRIDRLQRTLDQIYKQYINPEFMGKILLVDDDALFHQQIEVGFPSYQIISAFNGQETVKALETHQIDLILMDLELSPGNFEGIELTQLLKKRFPRIPLIVISTHCSEQVITKTLSVGADHYLSKINYDRNEWQHIFTKILAGLKYGEEEILAINQQKKSQTIILVIEDDPEWYQRIAWVTKKYDFVWAKNPAEALEIIELTPPDLILLDLFFKKGNEFINEGIGFIEELRTKAPGIAIVVVTMKNHSKMIDDALNKGADFYLRKEQYNSGLWLKTFDKFIELKRAKDNVEFLKQNNLIH